MLIITSDIPKINHIEHHTCADDIIRSQKAQKHTEKSIAKASTQLQVLIGSGAFPIKNRYADGSDTGQLEAWFVWRTGWSPACAVRGVGQLCSMLGLSMGCTVNCAGVYLWWWWWWWWNRIVIWVWWGWLSVLWKRVNILFCPSIARVSRMRWIQ